eukprot:2239461-Pyramimonas_sp.AAC.2
MGVVNRSGEHERSPHYDSRIAKTPVTVRGQSGTENRVHSAVKQQLIREQNSFFQSEIRVEGVVGQVNARELRDVVQYIRNEPLKTVQRHDGVKRYRMRLKVEDWVVVFAF